MKKVYSFKGGFISRILLGVGLVVMFGNFSAFSQTEVSDSKIKTPTQTELQNDTVKSIVKTQKINPQTNNKPVVRDNYVQIVAKRDGEKMTCTPEIIYPVIIENKEGGDDEN